MGVGVLSGWVLGDGGSEEGDTCDIRDSRVYPGGSGRDRGDGGRVNVGGVGVRGDGLCWEGVGG